MIEDETVRWHHQLNGHEFEQTPGDGERQGSLACCSPRNCNQSVMTERLNNSNNNTSLIAHRLGICGGCVWIFPKETGGPSGGLILVTMGKGGSWQ